jgi:antitoxin CcdA
VLPDQRFKVEDFTMGERVTVEIDSEALAAARAAGIDLSQLLSEALRRRLPSLDATAREETARKWYEENKEAVDAYNKMIEEDGFVFSDGARTF